MVADTSLSYKASSLVRQPSPTKRSRNGRSSREFDPSKYSTRLIALKFAYLGQKYNGLEHHANNTTALPTVEEVLWRALNKACLIFPTPDPSKLQDEVNWNGCEYSKCGRTDRGVSAFGQVIGIRVRSNRPPCQNGDGFLTEDDLGSMPGNDLSSDVGKERGLQTLDTAAASASELAAHSDTPPDQPPQFDYINDEIPYAQVLNRLLPPDIRVLAWCPSPPDNFSARFACKERRYRYFFTQPAFSPTPAIEKCSKRSVDSSNPNPNLREGWLNIHAMREAAKKFEGLHDFRNFCKVDPSKQIENFERRMFDADIEELDPQKGPLGYVGLPRFQKDEAMQEINLMNGNMTYPTNTPRIFTFSLHGSAFLWHQVRHMVAILFLIGQELERPGLVDQLLDVQKNPLKPQYEMADDAPLVLWDCVFPDPESESREDALRWVYVGDHTGHENGILRTSSTKGSDKYSSGGIVDEIWKIWRQNKINEVLAGTLLDVMVGQGQQEKLQGAEVESVLRERATQNSQKVFAGGNGPRLAGAYVPIMSRPRMERVEDINARYVKKKDMRHAITETDAECSSRAVNEYSASSVLNEDQSMNPYTLGS